jgi:CHASE2 domain-containing sensor protein/signal transduction histidine kinase
MAAGRSNAVRRKLNAATAHSALSAFRRGNTAKFLLRLVAAIGATALAMAVDLDRTVDDELDVLHAELRGPRATKQRVVLVAADDETVAAWGPPPWPPARLAALRQTIATDRPALIAAADPWLSPPPSSPAPLGPPGEKPPSPTHASGPALLPQDGAPVRAIPLRTATGAPTLVAEAAAAAGLVVPDAKALVVDYLGEPSRLPTLSAARVENGEAPAGTFSGRLVLVGVTAPVLAPRLPTPVGAMAPALIQGHALATLADGAARRPLPRAFELLLALGACIVGVGAARRHTALAVVQGLGVAAILVGLAHGLRARDLDAHAGLALVGLGVGLAATWLWERALADDRLLATVRRLARRHDAGDRPEADGAAEGPWSDFARLGALYLDARAQAIAELPAGQYHLRFRHFSAMSEKDVAEKRRDVRRLPYRQAHLAQKAVDSDRYLLAERGELAVLVPLIAFTELLGFWVLAYPAAAPPDERQRRVIDRLAGQIAVALEQRRLAAAGRARAAERPGADGRLLHRVNQLARLGEIHARREEEALGLVHHLPAGVLTATLWGEVTTANAAMRAELAQHGIDDPVRLSLVEVVERVSGRPPDAVHALLRRLVDHDREITLPRAGRPGAPPGPALVLARFETSEAEGEGGARERRPASFVLVAPPHAAYTVDAADDAATPGSSPTARIDLRVLLATAVARTRRGGGRIERPFALELPEPAPAIVGDAAQLGAAFEALLAEARQFGRPDAACRVVAEDDADGVVVHIMDPSYAVPRSALEALLRESAPSGANAPGGAAAGAGASGLAKAREYIEANRGTLSAESRMGSGTIFHVRLPREPAP